MALLHNATLTPTKPQLLTEWVPTQPWGADGLEVVGAYRFDDPADEVGIETHLLRAGDGRLLQVPLTYRAAPLAGAESQLIATMDHSVLGQRWVYDGCGDPVYVRALAAVVLESVAQSVLESVAQSVLEYVIDGRHEIREPTVRITATTGTPAREVPPIDSVIASSDTTTTVIETGSLRVVVRRRLDVEASSTGSESVLFGTWDGASEPVLLAYVD